MSQLTEYNFLAQSAEQVAPRLLGCKLVRQIGDRTVSGVIVETEAYDQSDAASHSYRGETARTSVMFGEPGHLYVYFTYGMHYCANVVTGTKGHGSAVLIRAIEPIEGKDVMQERRGYKKKYELTNGPAKLCQALDIDMMLYGHDLSKQPLRLIITPPLEQKDIVQTVRVGISKAKDIPWRFYIKDNPYVSRQ